jgi:hypothetical protein
MRAEGFVYIYSNILQQDIAVSEKTGIVYCSDKIQYSVQEIEILDESSIKISLPVHRVKRVFGGEIVKVIPADIGGKE